MKRIYITLISVLAIIMVLLAGLIINILTNGLSGISTNFTANVNMKMESDKSYNSEGIENIEIDLLSDDIQIFQNNTEEIRVIEYIPEDQEDYKLATSNTNGNTFKLYKRKINFAGTDAYSKVEFYVPKNFHKNLEVKTTNGRIKMWDHLNLQKYRTSSSFTSKGIGFININNMGLELIVIMAFAAVITCILVYYSASRPKYPRYNLNRNTNTTMLRKAISSTLWTLIVLIYLLISFCTFRWDITWIIFLSGACAEAIINLIFSMLNTKVNSRG